MRKIISARDRQKYTYTIGTSARYLRAIRGHASIDVIIIAIWFLLV